MTKLLILATLVAAGCSKKASEPGASGASGPACSDAITKAVDNMAKGGPPSTVSTQLKAIMTTRCTEDAWPRAVIDCYARSDGMPGMRACREQLDPALSAKLMEQIRGVMMSQGGGQAPAGHGMGGAPAGGAGAPAASGSGEVPAGGAAAGGAPAGGAPAGGAPAGGVPAGGAPTP